MRNNKSEKKRKILLIGGGTGGHILPLVPLMHELQKQSFHTSLVVADSAFDRKIIQENIASFISPSHCHYIKTGKIRYYWSLKNFRDFFLIIASLFRAWKILRQTRPDILFFKGGFVGFPFLFLVKIGIFRRKIYLHQSDISAGFLEKFGRKNFAKIFSNFGNPPKYLFFQTLKNTSCEKSKKWILQTVRKKTLLIFGGSQGALAINQLIKNIAPDLCKKYRVILISGIGKQTYFQHKYFIEYDFVSAKHLEYLIEQSDIVVSRSGASIFQCLAAKKPTLLIPLRPSARDHQWKNAEYLSKKGLVLMISQDKKIAKNFIPTLTKLEKDKKIAKNLSEFCVQNMAKEIAKEVL